MVNFLRQENLVNVSDAMLGAGFDDWSQISDQLYVAEKGVIDLLTCSLLQFCHRRCNLWAGQTGVLVPG